MKTRLYLPDGIEDLLQPAAWRFEQLRRSVLDLFASWGFQYIEPPVVEYLDTLLVSSGTDLDLQTLKVLDQLSGKQLGVRADLTSQVIRIDAQHHRGNDIERYCYAGPVVFASPVSAVNRTRLPFKVGVEIFGTEKISADAEVVNLMLETVLMTGVSDPVLLLGHMGVYDALVAALIDQEDLVIEDEPKLFKSVQLKSQSDIGQLLKPSRLTDYMKRLPMIMGDDLSIISSEMKGAPDGVHSAIEELKELRALIDISQGSLRFDLAELHGYGYHNGPVYSVYHPKYGSALAQGGRYNGSLDEEEKNKRPATGFDMDLKFILKEIEVKETELIFAPFIQGKERERLISTVADLRTNGKRVVCALSDSEAPSKFCTHSLLYKNDQWVVSEIV